MENCDTIELPKEIREHFCSDSEFVAAKKIYQYCDVCEDFTRHVLLGVMMICDECGHTKKVKEFKLVIVESKAKEQIRKTPKLLLFLL